MLIINNREAIRSGFVRCLRLAFESNTDFPWKWNPNDPSQPGDEASVFIYDAFPWKKVSYPAVIVSMAGADVLMRTMGQDHISDSIGPGISINGGTYYPVNQENFMGAFQNTIHITVYARSGVERSRVMDWIVMYIRQFFIATFAQAGITFVSMRQTGENVTLVGADPVYNDGLDITVYSEYSRDLPVVLGQTIDSLCFISISTLLPNGTASS